jgi:hypothetical protein
MHTVTEGIHASLSWRTSATGALNYLPVRLNCVAEGRTAKATVKVTLLVGKSSAERFVLK